MVRRLFASFDQYRSSALLYCLSDKLSAVGLSPFYGNK
jgi:hypothetical protein